MVQELRGITWDHPRGHGSLVAASAAYASLHPEVQLSWYARSLQAFADAPVEDLASQFDLVVVDHPHVGQLSGSGSLVALDLMGDRKEINLLAEQSVGASHRSYQFGGHQWALAIDAAAHVSAYCPDRLAAAPSRWDDVIALAREGAVVWPYKPVDALMSFFTLASNLGHPCFSNGRSVVDREAGAEALDYLFELAGLVPDACSSMNPISALDAMSSPDGPAYCPLLFGYSNYARPGFRPRLVRFQNIPAVSSSEPVGAVLGGAGIAVSVGASSIEEAIKFGVWVAGADCQRTSYFEGGGQPANAVAWGDEAVNQASSNFFRDTRETLERAWLRPRFPGFLDFQASGGAAIHDFLLRRSGSAHTLELLQGLYEAVSEDKG
jgi:multiple sugar transport system substrate-binding protein